MDDIFSNPDQWADWNLCQVDYGHQVLRLTPLV